MRVRGSSHAPLTLKEFMRIGVLALWASRALACSWTRTSVLCPSAPFLIVSVSGRIFFPTAPTPCFPFKMGQTKSNPHGLLASRMFTSHPPPFSSPPPPYLPPPPTSPPAYPLLHSPSASLSPPSCWLLSVATTRSLILASACVLVC